MKLLGVTAAAFILTATAGAATPSRDMAQAMKALHYPKAGALKIGCRTISGGFRCKATYRHHRVRRFYAKWATSFPGLICAGRTLAGCKQLRRGFITNAEAARVSVRGAAQEVSRGYMALHYDAAQPYPNTICAQSTQPSTWSFCYFVSNTSSVNLAVHMGKVKTGYVTTITAVTY